MTPVLKGAPIARASVVAVVALAIGAAALSISASSPASPSGHPQLAASVRQPPAPRGWKVVSYDGVHVDVPSQWPVVDGMHTGFCGGPFSDTPTAFVGPDLNGAPGCAPTLRPTPARYGVWLFPSTSPGTGPTVVISGERVVEEDPNGSGESYLGDYWLHDVYIEVGIGPDPQLVQEIVHSIGFTRGLPNTAAAGTCAMSKDPDAMPTPERLSKPLVLDRGSEELKPPSPVQHAVMTASSAWTQSEPKQPYEHYRLILARFFAQYPAQMGPGGSSTPLNDGQLDWVVYSSPISASIQGCGSWGLDVFDATTGQGVESDGWSPGP
jgi:hypothetical protein